jgi:hypothetical protein
MTTANTVIQLNETAARTGGIHSPFAFESDQTLAYTCHGLFTRKKVSTNPEMVAQSRRLR